MSDNVTLLGEAAIIATDDVGGVQFQRVKLDIGADGASSPVSADNPMPVRGPVTDDELRATALPVRGPVTDDELRATALPVRLSDTALFADTFAKPDPTTGAEPVLVVAMHPDYPLSVDPGQTLPMGGRTRAGHLLTHIADETGAQILSDAPKMVLGVGQNTSTLAIVGYCDTQGYQSISLQLFGAFVATVSFYTSNDSANWVPLSGYSAAGGATPVASATGAGVWILPAAGRYFKAQITAYTSGVVQAICYLRNQPMPMLASTPPVNVAQIAGAAPVVAGVAGLQAIGGNIAPGLVPTAHPVPMGGWDGFRTRRVLTDSIGAVAVTGTPMETPPVYVQTTASVNGQDGVADALNQIAR